MVAALGVAKRPVPNYLQALSDTYLPPAKTAQVAFAMHCFWTGEMKLGQLEGVLTTEAGWIEGHEVTLVHYDPARVSLQALVKKAHTDSCAAHVYLGKADQKLKVPQERVSVVDLSQAYRKARASDQKRQLQGTVFARISQLKPVARPFTKRRSPTVFLPFGNSVGKNSLPDLSDPLPC